MLYIGGDAEGGGVTSGPPRRWTVSGEGEGERHLEAARARLVVLREAARAELELAADLGILACERRELARRPREVVS